MLEYFSAFLFIRFSVFIGREFRYIYWSSAAMKGMTELVIMEWKWKLVKKSKIINSENKGIRSSCIFQFSLWNAQVWRCFSWACWLLSQWSLDLPLHFLNSWIFLNIGLPIMLLLLLSWKLSLNRCLCLDNDCCIFFFCFCCAFLYFIYVLHLSFSIIGFLSRSDFVCNGSRWNGRGIVS